MAGLNYVGPGGQGSLSFSDFLRGEKHEQRNGQQKDSQEGTGQNPEGKEGREKSQEGKK
jgi:hypothetical protein